MADAKEASNNDDSIFSINKERIKFKMISLIQGYIKVIQLTISYQIPNDIIQLLISYIWIDNGFIIAIKHHSTSQIMKIHDINDKCSTIYNTNIHFTAINNGFCTSLKDKPKSNCVATNCALPICMKTECDKKYGKKFINGQELLSNNNWNLTLNFYNIIYHITALNKSFYKYDNNNNNIIGYRAFK